MTRKEGPLTLSEPLPRMLGALRAVKRITAAPTAMVADVKATEKALKGEIPNDLLGYWLATGRGLHGLIDMTRGAKSFLEANGDDPAWREVAKKFDYIVFDEDYSDEGPLCVKVGNDKPPTIVMYFLRKADPRTPTFEKASTPSFVSYLKWKYPGVDFRARAEPVEVHLGKAPPVAKRRVSHPKFGEGEVLQEIPPDKVEIDFGPPNGVKKLLKGPWFT